MKNKTQKYYWKLVSVTRNPELFTSCIIKCGIYSLRYKIGIPTTSAMSENGIFVFNTRKNAREFETNLCQPGSRYKIFKCTVQGEEITNPRYYNTYVLGNFEEKEISTTARFPEGTKSFPAVTLVKQ